MKKITLGIFTIITISLVTAQEANNSFLKYYFNEAFIETKTGLFDSNSNELILSINANSSNVIQKGVVYVRSKDKENIYFEILGPFLYSNGLKIIDVSKAPGIFYGWKVSISKEGGVGKPIGLSLQWFANNGNSTTDGIFFVWESKNSRFRVDKIDPSQY